MPQPNPELEEAVKEVIQRERHRVAEYQEGYKNLERGAINIMVDKVQNETSQHYSPIVIRDAIREALDD